MESLASFLTVDLRQKGRDAKWTLDVAGNRSVAVSGYGSSASESDIDAWVLTLRHNPPTPTPIPSEKKTGEEVIKLSSTGKDRKKSSKGL